MQLTGGDEPTATGVVQAEVDRVIRQRDQFTFPSSVASKVICCIV